uniref:Periviscerokinin-1 n=1 Tax=Blattella germanica TaxID=6973 RepID=PVK1_BLAGE|nr:RecName: Full=Periviscerokinin-1; Short=BlaGe-PVK-1 [Blattella germanica]
GSSGLIPMGRV